MSFQEFQEFRACFKRAMDADWPDMEDCLRVINKQQNILERNLLIWDFNNFVNQKTEGFNEEYKEFARIIKTTWPNTVWPCLVSNNDAENGNLEENL